MKDIDSTLKKFLCFKRKFKIDENFLDKYFKTCNSPSEHVFNRTSPYGRFPHCNVINYSERLSGDCIKKLIRQVIIVSEAPTRRNFRK